jgi:hypothetical protein
MRTAGMSHSRRQLAPRNGPWRRQSCSHRRPRPRPGVENVVREFARDQGKNASGRGDGALLLVRELAGAHGRGATAHLETGELVGRECRACDLRLAADREARVITLDGEARRPLLRCP